MLRWGVRGAAMAGRSVTVEMPDDLYARLERRAAVARRSLGDEVVHLLVEAVPDDERLPPELEQELARMEGMDDAALWRAARSRLTARESRRLESLHFKLQDEGLTEAERQEEQALVSAPRSVQRLLERARALDLPPDLAAQHDRHLHETPKRRTAQNSP